MINTAMSFGALFLFTSISAASSFLQQRSGAVIAIVSDIEIVRSDIAVSSDEVEFRYKLKTGHPIEAGQESEIEGLREQQEIGRLAREIQRIVARRVKARLGVSASEAEVLSRWREMTRGVDLDAAARQQRDSIAPLRAALKAVHEEGKDMREVYNTFLADQMVFQEWQIHARYYRTLDRRRILERGLVQTGQDLLNPDPGIRALVESEKLTQAMDEEIAKSDPSFAEYLELRESRIDDERFAAYPPNYLEEMRANWWRKQYREADIEILDERYDAVLESLVQNEK